MSLQHEPERPITTVAKLCRCSPDSVRSALRRLTEIGVLGGVVPLVNLTALGYLDILFLISLDPQVALERERILDALVADPRTSWVASLGGDFEIALLIPTRSAEDAWRVLESLSRKLGPFVRKKLVAIRRSFTAYGRRHLAPHLQHPKPLVIRDAGTTVELDAFDRRLLSYLSAGGENSARSVARRFGVAHATIDRRIQKMRKLGVIAGFIYRVNPAPLGVSTYRLMVSCAGIDPDGSQILRTCCDEMPNVIKLYENVGSWDYEIEVDATVAEDVQRISAHISRKLGRRVERIGMYQLFRQLKYVGYSSALE